MKLSRLFSLCGAAAALAGGAAMAQDWPTAPVKVVVGFPAGTSTDAVTRVYAEKLRDQFKQPFVIENKTGAAGGIAAGEVAKSRADGYTLYVATIANPIGQSVYKKLYQEQLKVDIREDFAPIALLASTPTVLVVSPTLPVQSVKELAEYAKARPGEVFYASGGAGTAPHLVAELFNQKAGTELIHVPYKSLSEGITDLATGRVSVMFAPLPSVAPFIGNGKVKPLAVASAERSPFVPDLPTFAELGYQQFVGDVWYGLLAPKGTPADIVNAVAETIEQAAVQDDTKKKLGATGAVPVTSTPKGFSDFLSEEVNKWEGVVAAAGIKVD